MTLIKHNLNAYVEYARPIKLSKIESSLQKSLYVPENCTCRSSNLLVRRVSRGGPKEPAPPPLEIKQQKKGIRANFKLFYLYFATFSLENIIFSAIF